MWDYGEGWFYNFHFFFFLIQKELALLGLRSRSSAAPLGSSAPGPAPLGPFPLGPSPLHLRGAVLLGGRSVRSKR